MVSPQTFRDVLAQWPSGVTIVTTLDAEGLAHGMAASSFSSVSLDPPLVSVCIATRLRSHDLICASGRFGVSVLGKDQVEVARRFGGMSDGDRFAGESWTTAETGVPLLDSALGWVDCTVEHAYAGGDHTIFVGRVRAAHTTRRSAPLLFHSRAWGQFADAMPDVATLARPVEILPVHDLATAVGAEATASLLVEHAFLPERQEAVLRLVEEAKTAGMAEVHLQDTDGLATPLHVRALLQEAVPMARPMPLRVGLHDRAGLGLVKALIALKSGVSHFDTSLDGHDGTVAVAHLVRLLDGLDVTAPLLAPHVPVAALPVPPSRSTSVPTAAV